MNIEDIKNMKWEIWIPIILSLVCAGAIIAYKPAPHVNGVVDVLIVPNTCVIVKRVGTNNIAYMFEATGGSGSGVTVHMAISRWNNDAGYGSLGDITLAIGDHITIGSTTYVYKGGKSGIRYRFERVHENV